MSPTLNQLAERRRDVVWEIPYGSWSDPKSAGSPLKLEDLCLCLPERDEWVGLPIFGEFVELGDDTCDLFLVRRHGSVPGCRRSRRLGS
jgi:hypothetical protein